MTKLQPKYNQCYTRRERVYTGKEIWWKVGELGSGEGSKDEVEGMKDKGQGGASLAAPNITKMFRIGNDIGP